MTRTSPIPDRLRSRSAAGPELPTTPPAFPRIADLAACFKERAEKVSTRVVLERPATEALRVIARDAGAEALFWANPAATREMGLQLDFAEPDGSGPWIYSTPAAAIPTEPAAPWPVTCEPYDRRRLAEARLSIAPAEAGIAETGTVLEWTAPPGGRLLPILAPNHVVLLRRSDLYASLADYVAERGPAGLPAGCGVLMTGPSRTADIEKVLILGVHGPHRLWVVLL
ncbi:MAG: hypothetical protein Kow00109_25320 [Acidobacteriota bacterium]